jgi:hypothetical protein
MKNAERANNSNNSNRLAGSDQRLFLIFLALGFLGTLLGGCTSDDGVGDECLPKIIPETEVVYEYGGTQETRTTKGFVSGEAYIETGSDQCETGVCGVFYLEGYPSPHCRPEESWVDRCPTQAEIEDRVYCTCRCKAPKDSKFETCTCPNGYECAAVLTRGEVDVRGSYCVKKGTAKLFQ